VEGNSTARKLTSLEDRLKQNILQQISPDRGVRVERLAQGARGKQMSRLAAEICELDFGLERNDGVFLLDLLWRRLARSNRLPILRPLCTVKSIHFRKSQLLHGSKISKHCLSVKRLRLISDSLNMRRIDKALGAIYQQMQICPPLNLLFRLK